MLSQHRRGQVSFIRTVVVIQLTLALLYVDEAVAKKRAVLIGISEYPNANSLIGPVDDANNMYKFLVETMGYQKDEIKLLTERNATRDSILSNMQNWLVLDTQAGDEILFYFSGHGFQIEDKNQDEEDHKDEAIAAYDVAMDKGNGFINMISDDEIGDIFDQVKDREVTVIIDSCHSGTLTRSLLEDADERYAKTLKFNSKTSGYSKDLITAHRKEESFIGGSRNRVVWSAVSSWQKALVDFETRNGSVFTNLYIKGVKDKKADKNKDSVITRTELLDYIRDGSKRFCLRNPKHCKTGLTPTIETTKDLYVENILRDAGAGERLIASLSNAEYFDQALAPRNEAVRVSMIPGEIIRAGQNMQVEVVSQVDGYLMIFDVRDDGEVVQLFPNAMVSKAHQNGRISKDKPMRVPGSDYGFRYEAFDPGSLGQVYAIVSENKFPGNAAAVKDLVVVDPQQYISEIATNLRQVWSEDLINRQIHWSAGKAGYRVTKSN